MKRTMLAALAVALSLPIAAAPAGAASQDWRRDRPDYRWQGGPQNRNWDPSRSYRPHDRRYDRRYERRMTRDDYIYRGRDGRYYCRRNDGTTGLVIGALGGGVLGNAIGGDTLSTLLGAAGGAVIGRSIDRGNVRCR